MLMSSRAFTQYSPLETTSRLVLCGVLKIIQRIRGLLDVLVANPVHSSVQRPMWICQRCVMILRFHLWFEMVQQLCGCIWWSIAPNQVKEAEED